MHQSHNIKWHIFSEHLKVRKDICMCGDSNCYSLSLVSLEKPRQHSDIKHLCDALINSLDGFARTEWAKLPEDFPTGNDVKALHIPAKFFIDYFDHLQNHRIKVNIEPGFTTAVDQATLDEWSSGRFDEFARGKFTELVKILLDVASDGDQQALKNLLILTKRPEVHEVFHDGQAYSFGWDTVASTALESYLLLNICSSAFPDSLGSDPGVVGRLESFRQFWWYTLGNYYCSTQILPHESFFQGCNEDLDLNNGDLHPMNYREHGHTWNHGSRNVPNVFAPGNLPRLKEYLKKCWRIMYLSHLLMGELDQYIGRARIAMRRKPDVTAAQHFWEIQMLENLGRVGASVNFESWMDFDV